jgi:hypothetical protein
MEESIKDFLQEELERLNRIEKNYEKQIEKYPRGSFVRKKVGKYEYVCLKYRIPGKKNPKEVYIKKDELDHVKRKIEERDLSERKKTL